MRIAGGAAKIITKRIINFILVIWGVVTLSFCLQVFTGTDPAEMIVRKVNVFATEEQIQAVREELGLDAPFLERYAHGGGHGGISGRLRRQHRHQHREQPEPEGERRGSGRTSELGGELGL